MVSLKRLLVLGLALYLGSSCQKEDADAANFSDEYRFFLNGTLNGIPFQYQAGNADYYLETTHNVENGVLTMEAFLAPLATPERNSFKLIIRSAARDTTGSPSSTEQMLPSGPWPFSDPDSGYFSSWQKEISVKLDSPASLSSFSWITPDSSIYNNQSGKFIVNSEQHASYPVELNYQGAVCNGSITHHINTREDCDGSIQLDYVDDFRLQAMLSRLNYPLSYVEWRLNDTLLQPSAIPELFINLNYRGEHQLSALITFQNGCQKLVERRFNNQNSLLCFRDFTYTVRPREIYDPLMRGTVELVHFDENGKRYSSYYDDVEGDFSINSISAFSTNEHGEPTSRFFFDSSVILRSADGSTLALDNAYGSLAVAHP